MGESAVRFLSNRVKPLWFALLVLFSPASHATFSAVIVLDNERVESGDLVRGEQPDRAYYAVDVSVRLAAQRADDIDALGSRIDFLLYRFLFHPTWNESALVPNSSASAPYMTVDDPLNLAGNNYRALRDMGDNGLGIGLAAPTTSPVRLFGVGTIIGGRPGDPGATTPVQLAYGQTHRLFTLRLRVEDPDQAPELQFVGKIIDGDSVLSRSSNSQNPVADRENPVEHMSEGFLERERPLQNLMPRVRLPADPVSVSEGGTAEITLRLAAANPATDTQVLFDLVRASGGYTDGDVDFGASNFSRRTLSGVSTNTIVIARGEVTTTIEIQIQDDMLNEGAESFYVQFDPEFAVAAAPTRTLVTIAASDPITVSVARKEGDTGGVEDDPDSPARGTNPTGPTTATFVVTLSGGVATSETTVDWNIVFGEGVGQASADDIGSSSRMGGEVSIAVSTMTGEIKVGIAADTAPEIAESYTVRLDGVTGGGTGQVSLGAVSSATAQIPANDAQTLTVAAPDPASVPEADGQEMGFTVQWGSSGDMAPTTLTVRYRLSGTAEGGSDYRYPAGYDGDSDSGTLMIAISTWTGTVTMAVVGDTLDEDDETITFEVLEVVSGAGVATVPANTSATVTIEDDDKLSLEVAASAMSVDERVASAVTFTVSLLNDGAPTTRTLAQDVRVSYALSGDATGGGTDYTDPVGYGAVSGVMVLRAGTVSSEVSITVVNDADSEGDERVTFALSEVTEGGDVVELRVADTTRASVSIIDDDVDRWFYVTSTVASVAEDTEITYTVGYDGVAVGTTPVTVRWTVAGTGARAAVAEDLVETTGEVVFRSGEAGQTISLRAAADTLNEGDEQFTITISEDTDVGSGVYSTGASVVTTITDDPDDALEISIARADSGDLMEDAAAAAERQAEFVISVGNATATAALTVSYAVSGVGVSTGDYTLMPTAMVTIAQDATMATVTLEALDDAINEGAETLNVELGAVEGALGTAAPSAVASSASAVIAASDPITVSVARKEGDTGGEEDDPDSPAKGNNPTGPTTATFVVTLSGGAATSETRVGWSIVFGEGVGQASATDIAAGSRMGQVSIAVSTMTGEIKVGIAADTTPEIAESYTVRLNGVTGGGTGQVSLGAVSSVTAQIPANDPQTLTITAPDPASVSEADGQEMGFTVQWGSSGGEAPTTLTVRYRLSGTAEGGADYRYPAGYDTDSNSGRLSIAISTYTGTVTMAVVGDTLDEDDETITFEVLEVLTGVGVATLPANTSASVTIEDDDKLSLEVAASAMSVDERAESPVTFTVSLVNDGAATARTLAQDVRVRYTLLGDATGGGVDYTDPVGYGASSGVMVLAAGTNSADVSVTVVNDDDLDGDETITFALTEVTAGGELAELRAADTTRVNVAIIDDESIERMFYVTSTVESVAEGEAITYTVGYDGTLVVATSVTVSWTVAGTGARAADVAEDLEETAGEVVFGSGDPREQTISLRAAADTLNEGDERFTISISEDDAFSDVYSTAASVLTTITDDPDDALEISIARRDSGDLEEVGGILLRSAVFTVSVGNATATAQITVPLTVSGVGVNADDYSLAPRMVPIAQGATMATVTLTALDDDYNEGAETLNVELGAVEGALGAVVISASASSASAVIVENDAITVSVAREAGDTGGAEGTSAAFVVTLSGGESTSETVVGWDISVSMEPGEASTADFVAIVGESRVPAGETMGRIEVGINDDDDFEADESYTLTLRDPTGGGTGQVSLGAVSSTTALIPASDLPVLTVAARPSASVAEDAGTVSFRVQYGDGSIMPSEAISVRYRLSGTATGAADDSGDYEYPAGYDTTSGTATIGTGASFADVSVSITDDMRDEEDETITFELFDLVAGGAVAVLPAGTSATLTIEDDDKLSLSVAAAASVDEAAASPVTFTVSLLNDGMTPVRARTTEVRVRYVLSGDATGGGVDYSDPADYSASSGVVVLAAGTDSADVLITVQDDNLSEGDETIIFALTEITEGGDVAELRVADTTRVSVVINDNDVDRWFYVASTFTSVAEGEVTTYTVGYDDMAVGATPVTVSWTVAGTEERGADVAADLGATAGELVFVSGGASEQTIVLRALADTLNEGDEQFTIAISEDDAFSGVYSTAASVLTTITDDPDDALQISIARGDSGDLMEDAAAAAERQAEFVISVGNATATAALAIPYAVSGVGVSAGDYTLMPTTMVTIAQGVRMATVTLEASDDNYNEGAETLLVELGAVAGALGEVTISTPSASVTIAENDAITVSVARLAGDMGGAEGTSAAFVVTLSGGQATSETAVGWDVSVSMEAGEASTADFVAISGELRVPAGETTGRIEVGIADDDDIEFDESYTLTLRAPSGGGTGEVLLDVGAASATAQIPANDLANLQTLTAAARPASVAEDAGTVSFRVQYGDGSVTPPQAVSVRYRLSGTATGAADDSGDYEYPAGYDTTSGTATIGAGARYVDVSVSITDDMRDEEDETITFELFDLVAGATVAVLPANTSATATIEDDDKLSLEVAASAMSVDEMAASPVTFTVSLLNDGAATTRTLAEDVRVRYTLLGDATGGGVDYSDPDGYSASSGVVVLAAGTNSADVLITVVDDVDSESDETITLALTEVTAGGDVAELRAADTTRASVAIVDDDITRRFYILAAADPATVAEGEATTYTVGYDGATIGATPVTVSWTVAGTGARGADVAADLGVATGELVFGSGETDDQSVVLRALADTLNEGDEQFTISISEDDGLSGVYLTSASVVTTITDDPADTLQISIARSDSGDLMEGAVAMADRQAEFVISVSNATATAALTIPLTVSGAGVSAGDYTLMPAAMVTIAQNVKMATATLEVVDDDYNEGTETLSVGLGTIEGALGAVTISTPSASAVIAANDAITVSVAREAGDTGGAEGTSAAFVVTLSGGESTSETVVGWDISVSMEAGEASTADFAAIVGELRVPAGETTGRIEVGISDDNDSEFAESYTLTLRDPTGGGTGEVALDVDAASATAQIPANDAQTLTVMARPSASVSESVGTVSFRVAYGDGSMMPLQAVSVRYRLSGTATGAADDSGVYRYPVGYDTTSGTATIGTDANYVDVSVSIVDDMRVEEDETITFELFELIAGGAVAVLPANTSATITIEDDDKLSLSVAASAASVNEETASSVTFTVSLLNDGMPPTRARTAEVRVSYVLSGDATGGGVDYSDPDGYSAGSGVVVLAADTNSTDVSITVVNDDDSEGDERVTFELTEVTAGGDVAELRAADTTRVSVTIVDDDITRRFYIVAAADPATVAEGAEITYRVGYDGTVVGATPVTVSWTVAGTEERGADVAADLGEATGEVIFGSGETDDKSVVLRALADTLNEGDERFTISISEDDARSDVYSSTASVLTTITDDPDDTLQISIARSDDGDLTEGAAAMADRQGRVCHKRGQRDRDRGACDTVCGERRRRERGRLHTDADDNGYDSARCHDGDGYARGRGRQYQRRRRDPERGVGHGSGRFGRGYAKHAVGVGCDNHE